MAPEQRTATAGRRVGELAEATGLTVRTLHYYDEIGLLVASGRSDGGHRLYDPDAVERLYRICLLRRLGLPLGEIGEALDNPAWDLRAAMTDHVAALDQRLDATRRLRAGLVRLLGSLDHAGADTNDLLTILEAMIMLDTAVQRRISFLVYSDIEATYDHLVRVFDLGPGQLTRDDAGVVVHAEIHAGDGVIWLHPESEEFGLVSPRSIERATAGVAVMVDDVDAHHRRAVARGAAIDYAPTDQPYGYREYSARDNEGGLWSFMQALD